MDTHTPNLPAIAAPDRRAELTALADRLARANGPVMGLILKLGTRLEGRMASLPDGMRQQLDAAAERALSVAFGIAAQGDKGPDLGRNAPLAAAVLTGAAGGAGGIATAIAELPVSVTVILHAIRKEARAAGFDPDDPAIKAECLRVFGAGSPVAGDDGVNTAFFSARLAVSGPALTQLIRTVAPRLAAAMGQKLVAQAVPVLGAVAGAALNAAFLTWYREVAAVRFALLRLAEQHGVEQIMTEFADAAQAQGRLAP